MKKIGLAVGGLVILLAATGFVWLWLLSPGTTPPFRDAQGRVIPGSIAVLEKITLGGRAQWICLRGADRRLPVLLVLHGGPGMPELLLGRKYLSGLERHFVVVNWDQPGGGKSFARDMTPAEWAKEKFVGDTLELTEYLRREFKQDKIYLLGHSWGSVLGMSAVQRHPEYYAAYIGVGQVVNMKEGERLSYHYALETARELRNEKAVKELIAIGEPPYAFTRDADFTKLMVERKWAMKFGANVHGQTGYGFILPILLEGREYTLADKWHFLPGAMRSLRPIWPQIMDTDLFAQIPKVEAPVYFCEGRYDETIPSGLTFRYYQQLTAPKKGWKWFENSAHNACYEEPDAFIDYMVNTVLPETHRP